MSTITVFTPTYNRANTLKRAFESLMRQSSKDFEWLIIDDGSTDNTKSIVSDFISKADFPIHYYWKENGGRHTAVNFSYQYLNTPYVVTLDSDDELLPDAIEKMINTWKSIPQEDYERFWCISGREENAETGEMVGIPYPPNINQLHGRKQRKEILKYKGEKHCCRKVSIHIQYPFPIYSDTKFVTENTVWDVINRKYDQYCVNDIYGRYYTDSPDSLDKGGTHKSTRHRTFYYAGLFYVNELFDEIFFNKDVAFFTVNLSRCAMLTGESYFNVMKSINTWYKKVAVTLGYPISYLWIITHKRR